MGIFQNIKAALAPSGGNHLEPDDRAPAFARSKGVVTQKMIDSHYRRNPHSFADMLSIVEYLEDSGTFLLDDCFSQAVAIQVSPIATEGRSLKQISELRDNLQVAFRQAFGISNRETDWVLQIFSWKDDNLYRHVDDLREYIHEIAGEDVANSQYSRAYLKAMEMHFRGVNKPDGLFKDTAVTGKPWRGQLRQTYCLIYRRCTKQEIASETLDPIRDINEVAERFTHLLASGGVKASRLDGEAVFRWLTDWFNPNPALTGGDREALYRAVGYPKRQEDKPFGFNLSESVLFSEPISDPENHCWWFDDKPHTFLRFRRLTSAPAMGQLTGEVTKGSGKNARSNCMMDSIPAGAILVQTIVFVQSGKIDSHLQSLSSANKGETQESRRAAEALEEVARQRSADQDVFYATQGVYVRGEDLLDLRERCLQIKNELLTNGVSVLDYENDPLCVKAYSLHLPCCFDPVKDAKREYLQLYYSQHLANMCPIFGREQGTGHPGQVGWNRGGEPLTYDMLGADKVRAAHGVVLGPQGSGKSATLNAIVAAMMAVHYPRMFILDKGGSFELLAEYFRANGLTVNIMKVSKRAKFSLCPYLELSEYVEKKEIEERLRAAQGQQQVQDIAENELEDDEDDASRDPLGEMEQSLAIMVTGGRQKDYENLTQIDRSLMRSSLLLAGTNTRGRKTLSQDIRDAMNEIAGRSDIEPSQAGRLREMAMAVDMFCQGGLDGNMFNTEGEEWPDADVTILDVKTYGSDVYVAQLALAYMGYMQRVLNKAEATQYERRDVVNIIDEAHLYTSNPLLGYQIAFAIKVARKIGLWMLLASQNTEDFAKGDDIKKVLGLFEWWFLLNLEHKEVNDLCRYKALTEEQKQMILSCTKLKGCYTESVVMGNPKLVGEMLVRQVPPSLFLALAMTDTSEKQERARLMEKHGLSSEYDAAVLMACLMDVRRGIIKPEQVAERFSLYTDRRMAA